CASCREQYDLVFAPSVTVSHARTSSAHSRGSGNPAKNWVPEFTNEVQHLLREVLQWETNTTSSHWKSDARLPGFKPKDTRCGKLRQLWIARHRQSLVR